MIDSVGINFPSKASQNGLYDKDAILKITVPIDTYENPTCYIREDNKKTNATILKGSKLAINATSTNKYGYIERVAEQIGKFAAYKMIRNHISYARIKCKQDIFSCGNHTTRNAVMHRFRGGFVNKRYPEDPYKYINVEIHHNDGEYFITDMTSSTVEERRAIHRLLWELKVIYD